MRCIAGDPLPLSQRGIGRHHELKLLQRLCSQSQPCSFQPSAVCRRLRRHGKISHHRPLRPIACALRTAEVETDTPTLHTDGSHKESNDQGQFGLSTRDLQRLAEVPAQAIFSSQTGIISSASQLAQLLNSSLIAGVTEGKVELELRRAALGSNSLPERTQVTNYHNSTFVRLRLVKTMSMYKSYRAYLVISVPFIPASDQLPSVDAQLTLSLQWVRYKLAMHTCLQNVMPYSTGIRQH